MNDNSKGSTSSLKNKMTQGYEDTIAGTEAPATLKGDPLYQLGVEKALKEQGRWVEPEFEEISDTVKETRTDPDPAVDQQNVGVGIAPFNGGMVILDVTDSEGDRARAILPLEQIAALTQQLTALSTIIIQSRYAAQMQPNVPPMNSPILPPGVA